MTRLSRLIPLLMIAVAFFGWETYRAWIEPPAGILPAATAGEAGAAPDNASGQAAAADLATAVSQITARPLLRPDRQPYKEVPFVSSAPQRNYEAEMARFTVLGILPIDGKERALVVGKGAGGSSERWELAEGDTLPGFAVKAILPDGVRLAADGKEFLLPLYGGGPKQTGAALRTEASPQSLPGPAVGAGIVVPAPQAPPKGILSGGFPTIPGAPAYQPGQPYPAPVYGGGNVRRRPPVMPSRPVQPTAP